MKEQIINAARLNMTSECMCTLFIAAAILVTAKNDNASRDQNALVDKWEAMVAKMLTRVSDTLSE